MPPRIHRLYHFTDVRNLPSIRETGGLYSYALLNGMGIDVPAPGGNDWSHEADARRRVDTYVHLCLTDDHPMEYIARRDGRIIDPIYLRVAADVLTIEGVKFTADVSNKADVEIQTLEQGLEIIDFEMLREGWKNYRDPEIKERLKQVKKYEILVPDHVPLAMILNLPND